MQEGQGNNEPGWTFSPGGESKPPEEAAQSINPIEPQPTSQPVPAQNQEAEADDREEAYVSWTASEYQANPKTSSWFGMLALGSLVLAGLIFLVTSEWLPTIIIAILGITVGIFGARKPHVLNYSLDSGGLHVGQRFYSYEEFKSFSVGDDQAMPYISLQPLRRFMPPMTLHYDPAQEDQIADVLADFLPYEDHKSDIVDNLSRRFRL